MEYIKDTATCIDPEDLITVNVQSFPCVKTSVATLLQPSLRKDERVSTPKPDAAKEARLFNATPTELD